MKDVIECECIPYEGGFRAICARFADETWRKTRFQAYNNIVMELAKKVSDADVLAEALTLESESVPNNQQSIPWCEKRFQPGREGTAKYECSSLIESGTKTNKAHLLGGNAACSPTMGILVQPIVGKDFEAAMDKQIKTVEGQNSVEDKSGEVEALKAKKIKILQQLAYHKRDSYKGFINLENH